MRTSVIAAIVIGFLSAATWATLCEKCKGGRYIASIGHCRSCGGTTSSGAFRTCGKCSDAKGVCEHCGKKLTAADTQPASQPADPPADAIRYTADDDGKTVTVSAGKNIVVQLEGNITTGFSWELKSLKGQSLTQIGKIKYVSNEAPKRFVGGPGRFYASFKTASAGTSTIELVYIRPWEKKAPEKTFTLTVKVEEAAASQPGSKPAASQPAGE